MSTEPLDSTRLYELLGRYFAARAKIPDLKKQVRELQSNLLAVRSPRRVEAIEEFNSHVFERQGLSTLVEETTATARQDLVDCETTMALCIEELVSGGMPEKIWVRYGNRAVALESTRLVDVPWKAVAQAPPMEDFRVTVEYGRQLDRWNSRGSVERLSERPGTFSVLGIPAFASLLAGLFTGAPGFLILGGILAVLILAVAVGELLVGPGEFLAVSGLPEVAARNKTGQYKDREGNG